MSEDKNKRFWMDGFEGPAKGGYFVRNDLFKFFKKLKANGLKPVGIIVIEPNILEVLVEDKEVKKEYPTAGFERVA